MKEGRILRVLVTWSLILLGLVLLVAGGDLLVRGASRIALLAHVSPAVVGLTVVAAGTSAPELVVSVQAAMQGSPAMSVGNVVGSNIFNIGAVLGVAALIRPLRIRGNTVRLEWPVMALAAFQMHLLARDGVLDRLEGGFLATGLVVFCTYSVWIARRSASPAEREQFESAHRPPDDAAQGRAWAMGAGAVLVGLALLVGGSTVLVRGAVDLARALGASEAVVGLTIVAAGTSLPELATSAVASWRGHDDIAVGNIVGSNVFNVLGILGITALVHPLDVPVVILERDSWWMLGFSAALFPLMRTGMRVNRAEGAVLAAGFCTYMALLLGAS